MNLDSQLTIASLPFKVLAHNSNAFTELSAPLCSPVARGVLSKAPSQGELSGISLAKYFEALDQMIHLVELLFTL